MNWLTTMETDVADKLRENKLVHAGRIVELKQHAKYNFTLNHYLVTLHRPAANWSLYWAPAIYTSEIPDIGNTRYQKYQISEIPDIGNTRYQKYQISEIPDIRNTRYRKYQISEIPDIGNTRYKKHQISEIPDIRNTRYWKYQISEIPDIRNTRYRKYQISEIPISEIPKRSNL